MSVLKYLYNMPFFSGRCYSTARLAGKTTVITGCNTGIGKETALDFYKRGARVIMACRSVEKAEEAKKDIIEACKDTKETGAIVIIKCDLSSLKSVRECAQQILDTEPQINILVNNAGIMMTPKGYTEDDLEIQIGTNHFAHFLLTCLLLPRIRNSTPARIVTVSSAAHTRDYIDLNDLNFRKKSYNSITAYAQSKLANILFSKELANKFEEHKISDLNTYSLHPGVIKTELGRHLDESFFRGARALFGFFASPFIKSPALGAQTTIYCALDEKCAKETGLYYIDCVPISAAKKAENPENAKKLWDISVETVGLGEYNPFTAQDPGIKKK